MINKIFLFLSALGLLDSVFLTQQHYNSDPFSCPLFGGCGEVTSSTYSEIFGIPVALLGVLYYGTIFLLSLASYLNDNKYYLKKAANITFVGFTVSVGFVYLQLYVIQQICFYCMLSAVTSTILFFVGFKYLKLKLNFDRLLFLILRLSMGFLFLWPFIDKFPNWLSGVSPTLGFLQNGTRGVFADVFYNMAGNPIIDSLYMFGLFSVGIALILGRYLKLAAIGGSIMMFLIYVAVLPPEHNPLVDEHLIYILVLWVVYVVDSRRYGGGKVIQKRKKKTEKRRKKTKTRI